MTVQEKIEKAVQLTWMEFCEEHPNQAEALLKQSGSPIDTVSNAIGGKEYEELMAKADTEADFANILSAVLPIAKDLFLKLL